MAISQVIEGDNPRYKCLVTVNEGELREITIPVARFNDGRWLKDIPCVGIAGGAKAMGTISDYLNKYVMNYNGAVIREIMKPGWTEWKGRLYYVTPKGVLSKSSAPIYSVCGQEFPQLIGTECVGSVTEFLELGSLTQNNPASIIISLYTITGFLYAFYKSAGVPVKFSLFLHGKRGSMKTSLALAMTQIEDRKNPKYTLRATGAGLEAGFRRYKDAIMLIDDLSPTRDAAEQRSLLHNLELMVRCFGDGTGKKRNNDYVTDNSKIIQYEAEGGAIITGEYVAGVESSLARSLFLPLNEGDVNIEFLSRIQEDNSRLTRFLVGFFSYLEENPQYYISLIAQWCKGYRESRQGQYSNHRYAEYYADLMTASDLLLKYGYDSGQLNENQMKYYHELHQDAVNGVIDSNDLNLKEETPIVHMCNAIVEGVESGEYSLIEYGCKAEFPEKVILQDQYYYYIPQPVLKCMKEKHDKSNGTDYSTLMSSSKYISKLLYENGVIEAFQESGQRRCSKKIGAYGNVRYTMVKISKLNEYATV